MFVVYALSFDQTCYTTLQMLSLYETTLACSNFFFQKKSKVMGVEHFGLDISLLSPPRGYE